MNGNKLNNEQQQLQTTINNDKNNNNNNMTTRSETPARNAKHVRINEDANEVQVIRVEKPKATPSIVARDHVKAAVESHQDAIQRIVLAVTRDYIATKSQLRQKEVTTDKLSNDAEFIPRSARVAFKLTAPSSVMETEEFQTLNTAMEETTKKYSLDCKKSIASVSKLVNEHLKNEIRNLFKKGLLQFCSLLYTQQKPYDRDPPITLFAWYAMSFIDVAVFRETFVVKQDLINNLKRELDDSTDTAGADDIVISATHKITFDILKSHLQILCRLVYCESYEKFLSATHDMEVKKSLDKKTRDFLIGDTTTATNMEIDNEASATPSRLRELVNEAVTSKTAKLQAELQKLKESAKRPAKNNSRGATSSSPSAPSPKKSPAKNGKGEKQKKKDEKPKNKKGKNQNKKQEPSAARKDNASDGGATNKKNKSGTPSNATKGRNNNNPRSRS